MATIVLHYIIKHVKEIKTKTEVGKSTKHKNCVTAQTFGLIVVERVPLLFGLVVSSGSS